MLEYKCFKLPDGTDREIEKKTAARIIGVHPSRLSQLSVILPPVRKVKTGKRGAAASMYSLRMVILYALANPVNTTNQHNARMRQRKNNGRLERA